MIDVERALLGAILLEPAGQRHLLDLVTCNDFYRPWHGQVLAAMRRLAAHGVLPGPIEVHAELKNDPDLPQSVSHDAVLLADLMDAAPRPSHAPAYAGLVISGAIRRQVALAGGRICQAAQEPGDDLLDDSDLDNARHQVTLARGELDACRARWEALPEPVRRQLQAPRGHTDAGRRAPRPSGQETRPACHAADAAGLAVLRDLTADSSRIADVAGWLRSGHFARRQHGELYALLLDLQAAGMPADPVITCAEARRRGIRVEPRDLADGTGALAAAHGRQVWRRAALARAARAGQEIQAAAANPGLPTAKLMADAGERLLRLGPEPAGPDHPISHGDARVLALPSRRADPGQLQARRDHGREAAG